MNRIETLITLIAALIVGIYHLHLYFSVKRNPGKTAIGMTNRLRQQWVETIMAERRDIYAVPTIRNWVMASSLLASTAILIV